LTKITTAALCNFAAPAPRAEAVQRSGGRMHVVFLDGLPDRVTPRPPRDFPLDRFRTGHAGASPTSWPNRSGGAGMTPCRQLPVIVVNDVEQIPEQVS
jgi:hypothetical protein